jgi:hypothetical protein
LPASFTSRDLLPIVFDFNDNSLQYRRSQVMENLEGLEAATERLNAGAQIAEIQPSLIEEMWQALSRIPRKEGQPVAVGMVAARLEPGLAPRNPEEKLAMMVRYALLNALIELGVLDEYMKDEALRKKVFAAAALLPCGQNDLCEAVAERVLGQSPPDVRQKTKEGLTQAGYDPDHLKVADKFIEWIRDHS